MRSNHPFVIALGLAACSPGEGAPTPVPWEPALAALTGPIPDGWALTRDIAVTGPRSARYNPVDDDIYVIGTSGLHRIGLSDTSRLVASLSGYDTLAVDPAGHVYVAESVNGVILRFVPPSSTTTWIGEFGTTTDDDPNGFRFAGPEYVGTLMVPGEGLVTDGGYTSPDGVWKISSTAAEGEVEWIGDASVLVEAADVAIGTSRIWVADAADTSPGALYEVTTGPTLVPVTLDQTFANPWAIAVDPPSQDLWLVDGAQTVVWKVDVDTGVTTAVLSDAALAVTYAGIDVTPDGTELVVTTGTGVRVYSNCDADAFDAALDCDQNGVTDICDIRWGDAEDCDRDRVPDACEVASGDADDCDANGRPDSCPDCRAVEVVFVIDTSASMDDEAAALCANISGVAAELERSGVVSESWVLGISDNPGGGFSCLTGNVLTLFGSEVPNFPPATVATLGACPGGNEVASEDWGRAVAVVAGTFWSGGPGGTGTSRVVVPIGDEGPWCGDPTSDPGVDRDSVVHAAYVAGLNDVLVYPIMGTGASAATKTLADYLATQTGGRSYTSAAADLVDAMTEIYLDACAYHQDCNVDGVLDECELADGDAIDCNCNGVLDECDALEGITCFDADDDDIGDICDTCTDDDGDGYGDPQFVGNTCPDDNCPDHANADQADTDGDGQGDACDPCTDTDEDGYGDPGFAASTCPEDVCPDLADPFQQDADDDGIGDACDLCTDTDADGKGDPAYVGNTCPDDVCPAVADDQADVDEDGVGDACDPCEDVDGDGFGEDAGDVCPSDNCPDVGDPTQADADDDGIGDVCDDCTDPDGDGFGHPAWPHTGCDADNCPTVANLDQADADADGIGDACDRCHDPDGDGYGEGTDDDCAPDNSPGFANADQADLDGDGVGDVSDLCTDPDGDGVGSPGFEGSTCGTDVCPGVADASQADADADGIGDACDTCTDVDEDGYGIAGADSTCVNFGVDCDDTDATVHPGAAEIRDDGIDQDCGNGDAEAGEETDTPGECGCQSAPGASGQWTLWALVGAALVSRRRGSGAR